MAHSAGEGRKALVQTQGGPLAEWEEPESKGGVNLGADRGGHTCGLLCQQCFKEAAEILQVGWPPRPLAPSPGASTWRSFTLQNRLLTGITSTGLCCEPVL